MGQLADRLDGIGSTIFAEMSALAVRTDSVNLGQGFPDEDGPAPVIEAAVAALRGARNQYPPGHGTPELLDAVVAHQRRHYGLDLDRSQVVATTGATEAIAGSLLGLVNPGDEVVVLEPYYDSYVAMIQIAGGVRKPVTLRAPDFRLDLEAFAAAITDRTRFVLLNTPHNPTGTVLNRDELEAIAALAIQHDLIVISDEVYEHLVFGVEHIPIATLPGMFDRTVTISSAGKTFSVTGWKIGWASGPAPLVAAVEAAKNWLTYASGSPLQPAVALALNEHDSFHQELARDLATKRDLLCSGLAEVGLTPYRPDGTYFVTTDVAAVGYPDGRAFCLDLPHRAGVVAVPAQAFYDDLDEGRQLVRWAFCKKRPVIEEAIDRLRAAAW